jgi:hypothetical protein
MKKILIFLTVLLIPIIVNAQDFNVQDMRVTLDDKYSVLTPDNLQDSATLAKYNLNLESIQKKFSENKIFLNALDYTDNSNIVEIVINVKDSYVEGNLKDYDDAYINRRYQNMGSSYDDYVNHGIYKTKKWVYYHFEYKYALYYRDCYVTIINGKEYIITYSKLRKELNNDNRNELKTLIDNIIINNVKEEKLIDLNIKDILSMLGVFLVAAIIIIIAGKFILPKNK